MDQKKILKAVDHTLLAQTAAWNEIKMLCDDAVKYETASVCIPPSYVKRASDYLAGRMKVCTVIGFPNGYSTTNVKIAETRDAIENGADEIDMVINLGDLKDGSYDLIREEIMHIKEACQGRVLKVIIETCLLTEEEKIQMCRIVSEAEADYIKTSTGFSTKGAVPEDIQLFHKYVREGIKIKAAGGISTFEDGETLMKFGADRLGTSRLVKIKKEEGGEWSESISSY